MLTRFVGLPDGAIGYFEHPGDKVYVYKRANFDPVRQDCWDLVHDREGGQFIVNLDVPGEYFPNLDRAKIWVALQHELKHAIQPVRDHDELILTVVYRAISVGFVLSTFEFEHVNQHSWRTRPRWWPEVDR